MANYTPEQIEEMRAAVQAADRATAEAAEALRQAYMKPVKDLIEGDEFLLVKATLEDIKANYEADNRISFQLNALVDIIPRLIQEVAIAASSSITPIIPTPIAPAVVAEPEATEE